MFEFAMHRLMGTNRLLGFNCGRKVEVTTLLSVSKKSNIAIRSSNFRITRWMNQKVPRDFCAWALQLCLFCYLFWCCTLRGYLYACDKNQAQWFWVAPQNYTNLPVSVDGIWVYYGKCQCGPGLLFPQFQKCLATIDNLWSFHHISRICNGRIT